MWPPPFFFDSVTVSFLCFSRSIGHFNPLLSHAFSNIWQSNFCSYSPSKPLLTTLLMTFIMQNPRLNSKTTTHPVASTRWSWSLHLYWKTAFSLLFRALLCYFWCFIYNILLVYTCRNFFLGPVNFPTFKICRFPGHCPSSYSLPKFSHWPFLLAHICWWLTGLQLYPEPLAGNPDTITTSKFNFHIV